MTNNKPQTRVPASFTVILALLVGTTIHDFAVVNQTRGFIQHQEDGNNKPILEKQPPSPEEESFRNVWLGASSQSIRILHEIPISIVLSHCKADMSWLKGYLQGIPYQSFTVISKCGISPPEEDLPPKAQVLTLPNVGRCDHTVAYWISQKVVGKHNDTTTMKNNNYVHPDDELIFFLKDNMHVHQANSRVRTAVEILLAASQYGFGCFQEPINGRSVYHQTNVLAKLEKSTYPRAKKNDMFKSAHRNLGEWWSASGLSLPSPLVPVCYGGIFAAKVSQMIATPSATWTQLEKSLSRGDNIEEGHFAERTWAGLLSRPITASQQERLSASVEYTVLEIPGQYMGTLEARNVSALWDVDWY